MISSTPPTRTRKASVHTKYLRVGMVEPVRRAALLDRLYAVYSETVDGFTREELASHICSDNSRLAVFYGVDDIVAGFSCTRIERLEYDGRAYAVFWAVAYFREGYHGGPASMLLGLGEALRFKLRHPRIPLAYLTRGSSPAAYRLLASTMPRVYPGLHREPPAAVNALVHELSARWKYVPIGNNPWVVQSRATPRHPSRLRRLDNDPYAQFYTKINPRFAEGEALLVWTPLDVANIFRGLFRTLCGENSR